MFGILRPCRHSLPGGLKADWTGHLCGLCLALRDEHGQLARTVTNYDGLVISVLVDAQTPSEPRRRTAGPCPLRGFRTAGVANGDGARLAAGADAETTLREIARLAVPMLQRGEAIDPAQAAPLYVRDKVARTVAERLADGGKA